MGFSLPTSRLALDELIDWFVPPAVAADREKRKQVRMFLISHLFGPFLGNTVTIALYLLDPAPGFQVAVMAASISGFWIFPFVLRAYGHYDQLALISIQNLMFCILWSCFFYGGVTSPTLPWVLTIPLLAFFYVGSDPKLRAIVLGMFTVNFAVFLVLMLGDHAPKTNLDFAALQGLGLVSTVAASLYVTMMALFYAKVLASQGELESEMRGHLATAAELRRATEEAESAGAAKAEFLAKMSHELRTPLNAVIGYSQMLIEDASEENDTETVEDLERIHSAGHHLLKLVNEILDLSKIEAGMMDLHNEAFSPASVMFEVVNAHAAAAALNGNRIVQAAYRGPATVVADESRLRQALSQLVANAVKFTKQGTITVTGESATLHGLPSVRLHVADTGIGIPADKIPHLFEQFSVVDDSSASKYGGTGLGLALSRKLCRLMGGDVTVLSFIGHGSTFTIDIPVSPPAPGPGGSGSRVTEVTDIGPLLSRYQPSHNRDARSRTTVPAHA